MANILSTLSILCRVALLLLASGLMQGDVLAQRVGGAGDCGALENAYGPFDYTNPADYATKLPRVEKAHFDDGVRQLKGHNRRTFAWSNLAADIDYTLRAFPNHHHALYTMAQYHIKGYDEQHPMRYSAYCYFDRAKRNSPNDGNVHLLEGIYLAKLGRLAEAENSYKTAISMMPDSAEARYNLGLLYLKLKNYAASQEQAKLAQEMGYPLSGLERKLKELGQWTD